MFRLTGLVIILGCVVPHVIFSGPFDLSVIDTPKAYTSYKGDLRLDFTVYEDGGLLGSAVLSITDFAFLGVYFDLGRVIGRGDIVWNQPGVLARFLISDGSRMLPAIAIGYSYFMIGETTKVDGVTVNGLYLVATHGFFLFGNEQSFSYGIRYPVVPLDYSELGNTTIFFGMDFELSPAFGMKTEIENIHFDEGRLSETFFNLSFNLNIIDMLSIGFALKYSPSIESVIRQLGIGYTTQF
jgi:hypothetical protein